MWRSRLPQKDSFPTNDANGNSQGDNRLNPNNVPFGIFGDDPRFYNKPKAEIIMQKIMDWLIQSVLSINYQ